MIDCPYKRYGCTFQGKNHYEVDDHVAYMTSVVQDDEHPTSGDTDEEDKS